MSSNKEYMRKYMLDRYRRRMTEAREKLGGKCARCGATSVLDFDHIDAATKSFDIGGSQWNVRAEVFWAEVAKCQLLCRGSCHTEKSLECSDYGEPVGHGAYSKYVAGCRCEPCKRAGSEYNRQRPSRRTMPG